MAREDLDNSPESEFRGAAFSVERSLKSFLSYSGEKNPSRFSHHLESLIDACMSIDANFLSIKDKVLFLARTQYGNIDSPSSCETLYEKYNPEKVISEEDAETARQYAGEIYEFVRTRIDDRTES